VQLKDKVSINDDSGLEKEADVLGAKAQNLGKITEATPEVGVAQRKGVGTKVVQMAGGITHVADDPNSRLDEASQANNVAAAFSGENGLVNPDGINAAASSIAGNIMASIQSVKVFWEKGRDAWKKRDFISGAEFFGAGGDLVANALALAKDGGAIGDVPILGAAVAAFNSGIEVFKSNQSLNALRDFEKNEKNLSDEEKYILNKKVGSLNIDLASNSADFLLNAVSIVGDFFPPVKAGAAIAQAAKFAFEKGFEEWTSYKSEKEKQAISRIGGGSKPKDVEKAGMLSAKVGKSEPDSLKSSNGTLMDMVNLKFEIEDTKTQISSASDEAAKAKLINKEGNLTTKLNESIAIYNTTMGNIDSSAKITISDVENLQAIHAKVIMTYLNKKEEEKTKWEYFKSKLGGPLAPLKDKILAELKKTAPEVTEKNIQDLSKGQHAEALWKKTQEALNEVSKGRSYFTPEELNTEMKAILEKYKVPDDQIKMIVRD
jgi:hypothetical protein